MLKKRISLTLRTIQSMLHAIWTLIAVAVSVPLFFCGIFVEMGLKRCNILDTNSYNNLQNIRCYLEDYNENLIKQKKELEKEEMELQAKMFQKRFKRFKR